MSETGELKLQLPHDVEVDLVAPPEVSPEALRHLEVIRGYQPRGVGESGRRMGATIADRALGSYEQLFEELTVTSAPSAQDEFESEITRGTYRFGAERLGKAMVSTIAPIESYARWEEGLERDTYLQLLYEALTYARIAHAIDQHPRPPLKNIVIAPAASAIRDIRDHPGLSISVRGGGYSGSKLVLQKELGI